MTEATLAPIKTSDEDAGFAEGDADRDYAEAAAAWNSMVDLPLSFGDIEVEG